MTYPDSPLFNFNATPSHVRDCEPSRDAADSIKGQVPNLQLKILDCIRAMPGGLTCDEAENILDIRHQTCSARFRELASCQPPLIKKLVLEDGTYAKRKTRSGRGAFVFIHAEAA